ncbi:tyrosine-type recombinase/integrase [Acidithiobacillus thiooxidans]|uniref:tyrosine-type recombinase/integrase n=1 Tax=Acidithiobacillus TaxID=119977 RepID=UPI00094B46FE|nr:MULTISPECIES: tyrosine-type recombinase/integrase [Acidithiobacillus]MBU2742333.1 tyrosine-type recombinase/integrase [Acidithiobacillus albertensis]MBU2792650.1 tyrosine-type recombinase/integrase [Acidithiobacillus thiooxidans]MBU2838930.1 tyrosine-type recombinase/integrase [Acidithiobacillus thiooxidans]MBU2843274.1 tyrosine-type recombinase/integrase [Acidithiobacillus thiooxidans]
MDTLPHWTRSPETVEDYTDLVRRLARRFVPEAQSLRGTECWIVWLERLRVQPWSEVTVRRYRAALLWFMESMDTFPQSPFWIAPDHREAILSAIRLPWAGESLTLPEQKTPPGKRMRSFGRARWKQVRQRLMSIEEWETVLWMEAVMRTGVRPIEWVRGVSWNGGTLAIPCAKGAFDDQGNRIRGLTRTRTLDLSHWPKAEKDLITAWIALRETPEQRLSLLKKMAKRLRWAWDQEFRSLRPRITLYTARHQFAANLRARGTPPVAIAAMMGHSSDQTQRTHYGRGALGKTGKGITAPEVSSALTALVRQHIRVPLSFPMRSGLGNG